MCKDNKALKAIQTEEFPSEIHTAYTTRGDSSDHELNMENILWEDLLCKTNKTSKENKAGLPFMH